VDNVRITQRFGKSVAAKRLYVSGSHNGVDFGAPIGTAVKATADGVIAGTGDTDLTCRGASFGRWILIKHINGLATTYGHLSVIGVSSGQTVKRGDVIGYSGNTGYSTGPHVHISVYPANAVRVENRPSASCGGKVYNMPIAPIDAYLDPMLYLPSNTK
jgi:murein DD-endopeptidase MepM/ murein hydrolase activator NlpD